MSQVVLLEKNEEVKHTSDSIVNSVIDSFIKRSNLGLQKYGTTLDRDDLKVLDWIQHAQDEMHDGILYLERIKQELLKQQAEKF